jgi:hypothetical protein
VRIPNVVGDRRYANAIARAEPVPPKFIPLPTLQSEGSLLAVPFLQERRVRGVIVAQSGSAGFFSTEHEQALSLLGMILSLKLDVRGEGELDEPPEAADAQATQRTLRVRHYADDDSVFIDDVYVIKGVAGRLLARVLSVHVETGRRTFTNRELRLEVGSRLAWARDNLDSRLLLLRQRLKEKECGVCLERSARGVLELTVSGKLELEVLRAPP